MIGIDEVGRGAWAGPMLVVGLALDETTKLTGLTDSKLLSPSRRQQLLPQIQSRIIDVHSVWVSPETIDKIGLSACLKQACEKIFSSLSYLNMPTIIDGNFNYLAHEKNTSAVIKADLTEPAVSAASVLAKELRDSYMRQLDIKYPGYGFSNNVGYGTELHQHGLEQYGPVKSHRRSYKPIDEAIYKFKSKGATG